MTREQIQEAKHGKHRILIEPAAVGSQFAAPVDFDRTADIVGYPGHQGGQGLWRKKDSG